MSVLVATKGLYAGYEKLPVVRDLDLHVDEGEVVALLGPNGAGKSTTLLTISGLLPALGGQVNVLGAALGSSPRPERIARRGVSHVPEGRALFTGLSVRDNLRLGFRNRREYRRSLADVLGHFPELEPLLDRLAGQLSGGEQQMLALGRALAGRPRLLMVDEMSLGLAPVIVQRLLPRLAAIAKSSGCGVLLVEQHIQQALAVADRGYVLIHGELVTQGTAAFLSQNQALLQSTYMGQKTLTETGPAREPAVGRRA